MKNISYTMEVIFYASTKITDGVLNVSLISYQHYRTFSYWHTQGDHWCAEWVWINISKICLLLKLINILLANTILLAGVIMGRTMMDKQTKMNIQYLIHEWVYYLPLYIQGLLIDLLRTSPIEELSCGSSKHLVFSITERWLFLSLIVEILIMANCLRQNKECI